MEEKQKVCILGAGIGGLSAAHELSKNPEYEITVYEMKESVGGQARAIGNSIENFSEYCWHVIGEGYLNLIPILEEIPSGEGFVVDHLVPMSNFLYGRYTGEFMQEAGNSFLVGKDLFNFISSVKKLGKSITTWDIVLLSKIFILAYTSCPDRISGYANVPWSEMVDGLSPEAKKWLLDSPSIYMGMKTDNLSSQLMLDMFKKRKTYTGNVTESGSHFYSFDGPINKVWFEPWMEHLQNQEVKFNMNEKVKKILKCKNKIKGIITNGEIIGADIFINSLDVEGWTKLTKNTLLHERYNKLSECGRQIQCQVLYKLDSKLILDGPTIIVLPDTEWCIMIRVEGSIWRKEYEITKGDILSAGVGIWHKTGGNGKTALESTREEIADEVWRQVLQNYGLTQNIKLEDGRFLSDIEDTPEWDIWKSYTHNGEYMTTDEPKFSNSVMTLGRRPNIKDDYFCNLYHANAYARTDMNIFCMESAAEAGKRVMLGITQGDIANPQPNLDLKGVSGWFLSKLQKIDQKLHSNGKNHPVEFVDIPKKD